MCTRATEADHVFDTIVRCQRSPVIMQRPTIYGDTIQWSASPNNEARYLIHHCLKTKIQGETTMTVSHSVVQDFAPVATPDMRPSFYVVATRPSAALPETMFLRQPNTAVK